jgi:uncharacterized SAM-binding protein YcdF (DUF218 family)
MKEWIHQYLQFDRPPTDEHSVDTIIVLGTSKRLDCFEKRISTTLMYADIFPQASIIFSGKEPAKKKGILDESGNGYVESAIMAKEAKSRGLASERIALETKSTNTKENVSLSLAMVSDEDSVLFITSGYLGRRVDLYAQKQKKQNYFIVDTDVRDDANGRESNFERKNKKLLYEAPRILKYGLKGDL